MLQTHCATLCYSCTRPVAAISPSLRRLSSRSKAASVCNPLPASFLRGGTSKGIFINRAHLPADTTLSKNIFLGLMGSPDSYGRQLNGMGGGISSLSKICIVGTPSPEQSNMGVAVEYTFVQIGIKDEAIDYSGNCGNLSSMIGVFALDQAICGAKPVSTDNGYVATVRSFNTNTNKIVDTTFPVSSAGVDATAVLDLPQARMAGVSGKGSRITMDFVSPAGARTGQLLPTDEAITALKLPDGRQIKASLIDATNPTVFIHSEGLRSLLLEHNGVTGSETDYGTPATLDLLEDIRQQGAREMGLDPEAKAQPKIAILSHPSSSDTDTDVVVHALSMGVLHKAVPGTVGLCLGVACGVKGTIAWDIVQEARQGRGASATDGLVKLRHPSGIVEVGATFSDGDVKSAQVVRTGRRLMEGHVWW